MEHILYLNNFHDFLVSYGGKKTEKINEIETRNGFRGAIFNKHVLVAIESGEASQ